MSFSYLSVADRNYQRYSSSNYANLQYLHHPSGVTVICLKEIPTSEVIEVDFSSTKKGGVNRAQNSVVGKGKKGGLLLQKETRLCTLKCKDGSEIVVRAGVKGFLAEVNDRLLTNPDLVRTAPENQGYIAIVTYGAGKRQPDELKDRLPVKRISIWNGETQTTDDTELAQAPEPEPEGEVVKVKSS